MEPDQVVALADVIGPVVADAGLYCESVQLVGQGKARKVTVTVDLPEDELGGVESDRLADVTRAISTRLDETDLVPGAYRLEVSTPGVGRPLTEPRHFKRARARLTAFRLTDGTKLTGRIRAADRGGVTIATADGDAHLPYADIAKATVQVEFKEPPPDFLTPHDGDTHHGAKGR